MVLVAVQWLGSGRDGLVVAAAVVSSRVALAWVGHEAFSVVLILCVF